MRVAPLAGAWIEIYRVATRTHLKRVAPLAGAWIEIVLDCLNLWQSVSLPSRERGLKFIAPIRHWRAIAVAPLAGAWIEIIYVYDHASLTNVAPLAGAWIEIMRTGMKLRTSEVAPLAGAWIEIIGNGSFCDVGT